MPRLPQYARQPLTDVPSTSRLQDLLGARASAYGALASDMVEGATDYKIARDKKLADVFTQTKGIELVRESQLMYETFQKANLDVSYNGIEKDGNGDPIDLSSKYDDMANKILDGAPERAKEEMRFHLAKQKVQLMASAREWEETTRIQNVTTDAATKVADIKKLMGQGSDFNEGVKMADGVFTALNGIVSGQKLEKMRQEFLTNGAYDSIQHTIYESNDPVATFKNLKNDSRMVLLTSDEHSKLESFSNSLASSRKPKTDKSESLAAQALFLTDRLQASHKYAQGKVEEINMLSDSPSAVFKENERRSKILTGLPITHGSRLPNEFKVDKAILTSSDSTPANKLRYLEEVHQTTPMELRKRTAYQFSEDEDLREEAVAFTFLDKDRTIARDILQGKDILRLGSDRFTSADVKSISDKAEKIIDELGVGNPVKNKNLPAVRALAVNYIEQGKYDKKSAAEKAVDAVLGKVISFNGRDIVSFKKTASGQWADSSDIEKALDILEQPGVFEQYNPRPHQSGIPVVFSDIRDQVNLQTISGGKYSLEIDGKPIRNTSGEEIVIDFKEVLLGLPASDTKKQNNHNTMRPGPGG